MAAPPSIDRQTFLANLRQSGLVSEQQLSQIASRYPNFASGRDLALALIEDGTLTRFHTSRLLLGRPAGFMLGQYRLLDQVGRGGMGRVFKAQHVTMGRIVALKVLAPEVLKTERAIELFLHEVQAVARLQHPNVVTAYDANQINGRYYLVMEFVDGPNLDQLVRKQGPLSVGLACDYVKQAANGLQSAHVLGMLHRDLKPANVLVQQHGQLGDDSPGLVKISDFGLARLAQPLDPNVPRGTILTKENTIMGTPDYLSPEQSRCLHKTDVRSDLYSLGCTFYFLLTGNVVFPGGTQLDKIIRHATEKPKPLSASRSDVPAAVGAIVEKLLAKKPEERYQTPAELAAALQPFAVSGPTPWAPPRAIPYALAAQARELPPDEKAYDAADASDGELEAMSGTLSGDASPTPLITPRRREALADDHVKKWLLIGVGAIVGLMLLLLLVVLLMR